MSDEQQVSIHLYFDTTTPPVAVARAVMNAVTDCVPDRLASIHWDTVELEEDETDE